MTKWKEKGNFGTDSRFFKSRERIYEYNQIELHQWRLSMRVIKYECNQIEMHQWRLSMRVIKYEYNQIWI